MEELNTHPETPLRIEMIIDPEQVPVLALAGELDSSNAVILEEHAADVIASAPARVAFDLAELRFMDSAGIAVLVTTAAQVPVVEVRNPSAILQRVLEASGLSTVFRITP